MKAKALAGNEFHYMDKKQSMIVFTIEGHILEVSLYFSTG